MGGRHSVGVCVALGVVAGVDVSEVVVDVVAVVVVVGVAHEEVDNVEDGEEEGDQAERAHPGAGCNSIHQNFFEKTEYYYVINVLEIGSQMSL